MWRGWFMLDHPHWEARTYAHSRSDTTKRKRKGGQNISASHYTIENVGVVGLSAVFGGWRLFVHRYVVTFLFARPLYMAAHTYGYASIYPERTIKIPARADTSGIIRSSKQDCSDDSDFRDPPPSFLLPSSVSPSHSATTRPFLVERCGQSRKPSRPETYCRSNRLESLLRKNIDEFCLRDIIRDGSQSKSYDFYYSI